MQGGGGLGFLVRVVGVTVRPLVLAAWSGSVVASWLYRRLPEGGGRLVRVSPLLSVRGDRLVPILSGVEGSGPLVVGEGRRVAVELVMEEMAGLDVVAGVERALEEWGVRPVEVAVRSVSVGPGRLEYPGGRGTVLVEASYGPTIHVFRGRRVLYPSPARLLGSAARSLGERLGRDLSGLARELLDHFELSGHRTRTVRLGIGRGRTVKAFHGDALFIASLERLDDILALLDSARIYGVGKSRGIGFGYFDYRLVGSGHEL